MARKIYKLLLHWRIRTQKNLEIFFLEEKIPDYKKLVNTLYILTTDLINGIPFNLAIKNSVNFISYRTGINSERLYPLFLTFLPEELWIRHSINRFICLETKKIPNFSLSTSDEDSNTYLSKLISGIDRKTQKLTISGMDTPKTYLKISYRDESDIISITIPTHLAECIIKAGSLEDTTNLIERYNFIAPESGLFWSIPPRVYKYLSSYKLEELAEPPIECFASPYNHNLPLFCSAYNEDRIYGSLGNFFNVITNRGFYGCVAKKEEKRRWIVNPPYTVYIFERVINIIENRLSVFPNDEFFFLLPVWKNVPLIETIRVRGILEIIYSEEYELFDHITGAYLSPPINLYVGYLRLGTIKKSEMFDESIKLIRPRNEIQACSSYSSSFAASSI